MNTLTGNKNRLVPLMSVLVLCIIFLVLVFKLISTDNRGANLVKYGDKVSQPIYIDFKELQLDYPLSMSDITADQLSKLNKWVFLSYGYTSCPDICPSTLLTLKSTIDELNRRHPDIGVTVLFYTLDPEVDTAERLREYVNYFSSEFITARANSRADATKFENKLGIVKSRDTSVSETFIEHNANLYLLDPDGMLKFVFRPTINSTFFELPSKTQLVNGFNSIYQPKD